ncbi:IS5 family transposase (plasmid) [Acidithiobacillus sp. YTS05]|nr:IS5 family transposase [Acidithiobacillus sp. YTS05]UTV80213.1 IS5 family transposase [Acidithiobacillus sp. YTS05]UTV80920.1 IS5 family transposase [Acidithiobacillus sp. YTS05]UTV81806.1 IS5 family transposase [Acidithiobacillus sp. YTS05]UTV82396.1 IS5 family transposase [Acidithiobacillus sp. YTS05]
MRGAKAETGALFSYLSPEDRVPADHPLRAIRVIVDRSLAELDGHFNQIYSDLGRPSIPPEHLLRALLLQVFYSVRSERQLMEQLDYNLLFRWFVGLGMDAPIWVPTVFTKNRDRLLDNGTVQRFFQTVVEQARNQGLLSEEHFSVDGTLLEAWASQKSFQPKDPEDRQGDGSDFRGQKRSNDTHASVTDPDCRLYKKASGEASRLAYLGHVLMDNRHGLIAGEQVTKADGTAEVDAAVQLLDELGGADRITLGADKGYDRHEFVRNLRDRNVTPHVARKCKGSAIDGRTTRHVGYTISIRVRKRIESIFGWMKTVGGMRKTRFRGLDRVGLHFTLVSTAYNLVRMARLGVA